MAWGRTADGKYTYKVCLLDKVVQVGTDGGAGTSLGVTAKDTVEYRTAVS